eukprot:SAG22_NODE_1178_length_5239_cov_67.095136_5_plen_248_part_00
MSSVCLSVLRDADQLGFDRLQADAGLIAKSERLVVALRRAAGKAQAPAATGSSWRDTLPAADGGAGGAGSSRAAQHAAALEWVADAVDEHLDGLVEGRTSSIAHRNTPGTAGALGRVQQLLAGYEPEPGGAGGGDWPYLAGEVGAPVGLEELLQAGAKVAAGLGPAGKACADAVKQVAAERAKREKAGAQLLAAEAKSTARHAELGAQLGRLQAAAGEPLLQYAGRCRGVYFAKLASGEVGSFEGEQ